MMSNYPPGAENDPNAPYNEPQMEEVDILIKQTLTKEDVIYVRPAYSHGEYEYDPVEGVNVGTTIHEYGDDLDEYYKNQHLTPMEIIQKCKKIVHELRKTGCRWCANVNLPELEEECENWEVEQTEVIEA